MFQSEQLQEKWSPLLDYEGLDPIKDNHRRAVTAVLLENQEKFLKEEQAFQSGINLMESPPPIRLDLVVLVVPPLDAIPCCWFRPRSDLPDQTCNA